MQKKRKKRGDRPRYIACHEIKDNEMQILLCYVAKNASEEGINGKAIKYDPPCQT